MQLEIRKASSFPTTLLSVALSHTTCTEIAFQRKKRRKRRSGVRTLRSDSCRTSCCSSIVTTRAASPWTRCLWRPLRRSEGGCPSVQVKSDSSHFVHWIRPVRDWFERKLCLDSGCHIARGTFHGFPGTHANTTTDRHRQTHTHIHTHRSMQLMMADA